MGSSLLVLLIVLVGLQFSAQAPINGGLGRTVGRLAAALVSNSVGTVLLFVACLLTGSVAGLGLIDEVPAWQLAGGFIGAAYVGLTAITVSRVGAGVIAAVTITGQLLCSVVVDHFGWFGIPEHDLTAPRVAGLVLLLAGAMTMVYSRQAASDEPPAGPGRPHGGAGRDSEARGRLIIVAILFAVAVAIGVQHPINSELAVTIGDVPAGFVNFAVGTVVLAGAVLTSRRGAGLVRIGSARPVYFLGGLIGAIVVVASLVAVTEIGAAGLTAALVSGQLIGSVILDRFGAFGLKQIPVSAVRLAAAAALLAGTFLATG